MRRKTTVLGLVSLLALACGGGHHGEHAGSHGEPAHELAEDSEGLRLNLGEKWEMDDHTRSMLAAMTERVGSFKAGSESAAELGTGLQDDVEELIQGCTMTGDAHTELHRFLMGLIPAIQELVAGGGEAEVRAVERVLATYPSYFE